MSQMTLDDIEKSVALAARMNTEMDLWSAENPEANALVLMFASIDVLCTLVADFSDHERNWKVRDLVLKGMFAAIMSHPKLQAIIKKAPPSSVWGTLGGVKGI